MSSRYQNLFNEVVAAIQSGDTHKAARLVKPSKELKDKFVLRSLYLLYSAKGSSYYSPEKAKSQLDALDSQSDMWGISEKGRCLLYGEIYEKDTYLAEDTLMKAIKTEASAKYFVAKIHSDGYHKVDGEPVFDSKQAARLYFEVSRSDSKYSSRALLEYCKIKMKEDNLDIKGRVEVFGSLSRLMEINSKIAIETYTLFLMSELNSVIVSSFKDNQAPDSMLEKVLFEGRHRDSVSAIKTLSSSLIKKD